MVDVWSAVGWWDNWQLPWQLRILVLGSLGIRWFLLVAAPMRNYTVWRCFRLCIWLAYISSDALAIYALATLFNRHANASSCDDGIASSKARILEVLWAPVLLIHLGRQAKAPTAFTIQENDLWIRHTVTLVSQVAVALYALYKSWWWHNPRDWKLLASEILLFIIGVVRCSGKPWALKKASINSRLASLSATMMSAPAGGEEEYRLPEGYKVYMVLLDMSLSAAADDLVQRGRARNVRDVLRPLSTKAEKELKRVLLRHDFDFFLLLDYFAYLDYFTRTYLVYQVLLVPILHIAALMLFVRSDKDGYDGTDVKITYILLCLTAALDVFTVLVLQLVHRAMSAKGVPALCETVPGYNLVDAVLRRRQIRKAIAIGWLLKCATSMGCKEEYFDYCKCKGGGGGQDDLYKNVSEMVLADLVDAQGRDLANYRVFTVPYEPGAAELLVEDVEAAGVEIMQQISSPGVANWALTEVQQKLCSPKIRSTLRVSFDRSVLLWHIATDLCFRMVMELEGSPSANNQQDSEHWLRIKCTEAISSYMARVLNSHPDMLLTGSRQHMVSEAMDEFEYILDGIMAVKADDRGKPPGPEDLIKIIDEGAGVRLQVIPMGDKDADEEVQSFFHIPEACRLAEELLALEASTRWRLMYRVWLGMLFYSASMCRGYLHTKSLDEGGEFLSYVWLILSLKGGKTLADKLQMPEGDDEEPTP